MKKLTIILIIVVCNFSGQAQDFFEGLWQADVETVKNHVNKNPDCVNKILNYNLDGYADIYWINSGFIQKRKILNTPEQDTNMVLIPGGEYFIGKDSDKDVDYKPKHKVYLDSFYIDKYEVTNKQYFIFCQETGHILPEFWGIEKYRSSLKYPNYPVVGVNYIDAKKYAEWANKRLPTEAEWEAAARGGLLDMLYPNGNELDSTKANINKKSGNNGTVAVGSFKPNNYGLYDMSGNVREWTSDKYSREYYKESPTKNPKGAKKGSYRVVKGGGWHSNAGCNRIHTRVAISYGFVDIAIGFRCVKDIKKDN